MEFHMSSCFNRGVVSWLVLAVMASSVLGQNVTYETVSYEGYTFSVSDSQLPWAQAKDACIAREQKLASVETPEKDDVQVQLFSEQLTNVTLKGNSWISATEFREGVWHWDSLEKPLYYRRWFMDGQPDDKENLNCVYLASAYMLYWRDANCSASMYFICEGPFTGPEPTPEPEPDPTTELTPDPTTELTPDPTTELTPDPTTELTPDPTTELTPDPTTELNPVPTTELTPEPTTKPETCSAHSFTHQQCHVGLILAFIMITVI